MSTISADEVIGDTDAPAEAGRAGVVAGEAYFSAFGVPQRRGRRLVCGADEDAVTMAVEAAQGAIDSWGGDVGAIDGLFVALDHGPEVADANPQAVREALGVAPGAKVVTFASDLGGLDALQGALSAVDAGSLTAVLVVAAEQAAHPGDSRNAGAAALIIQSRDDLESGITLRELARTSAFTHLRWDDSEFEPQEPDFRFFSHRYLALVDAIVTDLRARGVAPLDTLLFSGGTDGDHRAARTAYFGGDSVGAVTKPTRSVDFGVAGPLITLLSSARTLAGQSVGVLAHGSGQAVLLELRLPAGEEDAFGTAEPPAETRPPVEIGSVGPALALPAESPFFARAWNETLRLEAGRCDDCGKVVYPPSQRPICPQCHSTAISLFPLPRKGTVYSFVDNRFNPAGFPTQLISVLGELDAGVRYWAPMPPETDPQDVAIGRAVELRLRRFTSRHGLPIYAQKYVVARDQPGSEVKGTN